MSKIEDIDIDKLHEIQEESEKQERPDQKSITSVSEKIRKRVNNLPDPTNPPLGYDEHKAFDRVFPYINIPALHPETEGDTVIFNDSDSEPNKLYLGDNLEVLRTLKSETVDLIYIDPPFFSGRNYNMIWGDTNEVRTFDDIWEGGISSYLIWLNARLWEMRRILKKTGSIYVHCDWHASHYIKTEMDKIFGYENFQNEIAWGYRIQGVGKKRWARKHDILLFYSKDKEFYFSPQIERQYYAKKFFGVQQDEEGRLYSDTYIRDIWDDVKALISISPELIGYPTQKPIALLERILNASSKEGDVVADFFLGGGTTCLVSNNMGRKFIGCDSSRVAVSVTLDRLVKSGEEISGVQSNVTAGSGPFQMGFQEGGLKKKVPNIEVNYLGVYPIEKFRGLQHDNFVNFCLTAYGASRNTGEGITDGFRPPAQQEPVLIGPTDSVADIDLDSIQRFYEENLKKVETGKMINCKIIAWRFQKKAIDYLKSLNDYSIKNNLPITIEAVPLDSREFRKRILQRLPDVDEAELFLRFSKPPVIGDIKIKKVSNLEYEFEAIDTYSTNEGGWLVNCQWDFDYQEGHFTAEKEYILSREKAKDKNKGEIFEAVLEAKHKFEKKRKYIIACKVQDNLAGETILYKKVEIS